MSLLPTLSNCFYCCPVFPESSKSHPCKVEQFHRLFWGVREGHFPNFCFSSYNSHAKGHDSMLVQVQRAKKNQASINNFKSCVFYFFVSDDLSWNTNTFTYGFLLCKQDVIKIILSNEDHLKCLRGKDTDAFSLTHIGFRGSTHLWEHEGIY